MNWFASSLPYMSLVHNVLPSWSGLAFSDTGMLVTCTLSDLTWPIYSYSIVPKTIQLFVVIYVLSPPILTLLLRFSNFTFSLSTLTQLFFISTLMLSRLLISTSLARVSSTFNSYWMTSTYPFTCRLSSRV